MEIRFKREINNVSYQVNNAELHTLFGIPDTLRSDGAKVILRHKNVGSLDFLASATLYVNDLLFSGTAKQIVAKLRDEVFIDPDAQTASTVDASYLTLGKLSDARLNTTITGHIVSAVIEVENAYGVVADGVTDNATALMAMRVDLAGTGKPHYILHFPTGEIRYSNNRWLYGIERFTIEGHGAIFRSIYAGSDWAFQRPFYVGHLFEDNVLAYVGSVSYTYNHLISTVSAGASAVVSATGVDSSDCVVGARILIWGYVMGIGYPPLVLRHEYNEIAAINTGTDTITLKFPLKYSYLSTWFDQEGQSIGGTDDGVGKPRITFLDRAAGKYPRYAEFRDLTFGSNTGAGLLHAAIYPSQILKISNCKIEGFFWPSECETITIEDSEVVGLSEFDRLVTNLYCKKVKFNNEINGAAGIHNVIMEECQIAESIQIAPRRLHIKNTDLRASTLPSVFSGAIENQPGKFPMTSLTLEGLRISNGATNTSGAMIAVAPYSTFVLAVVSGNNILIPNTGNDAMFNLPRSIEAGSTKLFKNDGTKGGLCTSITYDATYNSNQGAFVIAGNWATPVVGETWVWCSVKNIIDKGGHQNFSSFRLWHENSMRWMGNESVDGIKKMRFTEKDVSRIYNQALTIPLYGNIIDIEIYVGKVASVANILSILNASFAAIAEVNMQEKGWRKLTHEAAITPKTGDNLSTANVVSWQTNVIFQCHNGSYTLSASDITDVGWPEFEIIIRWAEF